MADAKICAVEGCEKPVAKRSYCIAHYKRLRRHGDPEAGGPMRERQPPCCGVEGCERPAVSRGLCGSHYSRQRLRGDTGGPIERWPTRGRCSVEGCDHDGRLKRGMCVAHHHRFIRHGDPHVRHREPNGARARWLRQNVDYQSDDCLIWPFPRGHDRYGIVDAGGVKQNASRYMCSLAHGDPPSATHHAAHSCGNGHGGCVNPRHLRWATPVENAADKVGHGTAYRGERHWQNKLTEEDVRSIRRLIGKKSQSEIAKLFGIHQCTVSEIKTGRKWGWLT